MNTVALPVSTLTFAPPGLAEVPLLHRLLGDNPGRTCDFTLGGLYMWSQWFGYARAIAADTLFVRGLAEDDITHTAYSLPIGTLPLHDALTLLRSHAEAPLLLSAVPQTALPLLVAEGANVCGELTAWADYLYDITALATLAGKRYNKKRNHVNRFLADNAGSTLRPLSDPDIRDDAIAFHRRHPAPADKGAMALHEHDRALLFLSTLPQYAPYVDGAALLLPDGSVAAYTIGEVRGDTLHIHVEKADHTVSGAGEAINMLYARHMLDTHPGLRYVNRQDDGGDEGLRRAKESYHPVALLRKYNVEL